MINTPIFVLCCAAGMLLVEKAFPGRQYSARKHWWPRALLLNGAQALIAVTAAVTWDQWLAQIRLFNLEDLSLHLQVLIGYLSITFIYYWWHRARHEIPFLWRWFHQVHHSPARLEIFTSFYKHPLEIFFNSILSTSVLMVLLGLSATATIVTVLITGIAELFYHWNVRTPYWRGFIWQRPESHCIHHKKNHHKNNYSDLPVWDMLFGTFENPRYQPSHCGFSARQELALYEMLCGVDVIKKGARNAG